MLSRGDAVVYKCRGLYKVEEIGTLDFSFADQKKKYYTLQSVEDARDRPMFRQMTRQISESRSAGRRRWNSSTGCLRSTCQGENEKLREQEYKRCIADYCPENWVKVLKTLYTRTKSRGSITSMDKKYQMLLEHALYSEFAFVLGIPADEVTKFIADHMCEKTS